MKEHYDGFEQRIGYRFKDRKLLKQALTHSSFSNEQKINVSQDYERLEFLGDAVLELVSSDYIFHHFPKEKEGVMTKMRASMVCEPALAYCAREIELEKYIRLGKGEELTGGRSRDSIISDVMEATIGAIYLDGGMECAKQYIESFILKDLEDRQLFYDSKSNLQELVQGKLKKTISYRLSEEKKETGDGQFKAQVYIQEELYGEGFGRSKKAAEAEAAYKALLILRDKGYVFKKY